MKLLAQSMYALARTFHWELCNKVVDVKREAESADLKELADDVYAMKETAKLLDDARKEVNRLVEDLERQTCHMYVLRSDDGEPIRTQYCTATPDARQTVKIPKKGTPEYDQLLAYFGVPKDSPFSPDWNKMIERIQLDMAAGKPCPKGCDPNSMYVLPKVTITYKKLPVLPDGEAPSVQRPDLLRRLYGVLRGLMGDTRWVKASAITELQDIFDEDHQQPEESVKPVNTSAPAFAREQEDSPF